MTKAFDKYLGVKSTCKVLFQASYINMNFNMNINVDVLMSKIPMLFYLLGVGRGKETINKCIRYCEEM